MFKNTSFLKKSMILYLSVAGILVCGFTGIYLYFQAENIKTSMNNTVEQFLDRAVSQYEKVLEEMSRISYGIASDEETCAVLSGVPAAASGGSGTSANYFTRSVGERKKLQLLMQRLNGDDFSNRSIYVISKGYDYVNLDIYETKTVDKETVRTLPWLIKMEEENLSRLITPVGFDGYGRVDGEVFSFIRRIRNEFQDFGFVEVQLKKEWLSDIFEIHMEGYQIFTMVWNGNDLFYATEGAPSAESGGLPAQLGAKAGEVRKGDVTADGGKYAVYSKYLPEFGMTAAMFVSHADYRRLLYRTLIMIVFLGLSLLAAVLGIVYLITRRLYTPLRQLRDSLYHVDYEELKLEFEREQPSDEVAMLAEAFRNLLEGVRKKNRQLVESRTGELKARYQVLQAQINPHFMYNILFVIGLMGYQKGAPEIMDVCGKLTKMLRYSTGTSESRVSLRQEFGQAELYLFLMKYRYLDKQEYEISLDSRLNEIEVPKFILQPIAENCFRHSLAESRAEVYFVRITGTCGSNFFKIRIEDNGVGFTEETKAKLTGELEKVREKIAAMDGTLDLEIGGMGLINTYARLLIDAGCEVTFFINNGNNGEAGGSLVEIIWEGRYPVD